MTSSIYSIGLSGLAAAQAGLVTTGHNIANVDTPNYSRQEVVQSTRAPHLGGGVYFGTGTDVVAVRRVYGEAITQQLTRASAQSAQDQTRLQRITDLETLFGSAGGGVASAIDAFTAAPARGAAASRSGAGPGPTGRAGPLSGCPGRGPRGAPAGGRGCARTRARRRPRARG